MNENKDQYFDNFSNLIKKLKENNLKEMDNIEKYYTDFANYNNLSLQDIITYMLYCFEVIELTQKWKLKKLIDYKYFLNDMENIYNEIFCNTKSVFNNKIFASVSLGNIIEKTINYGVDSEIANVLEKYIKCIDEDRNYIQQNNLVLLRGNLYCQVYNVLKNNMNLNEICRKYFEQVNLIFDYKKYVQTAISCFDNTLNKLNLSYTEFYNFLSFKAYNNDVIEKSEIKKIFSIMENKYINDFFDKTIFIHLIKSLISTINCDDLKIELELIFDDIDDDSNTILLNYNNIDCSFDNNISFLQNIYYRANKIKYNKLDNLDYYLKLLRIKDELIEKKDYSNNSILNYQTMLKYFSNLEFNQYLNKSVENFNNYFVKLIKDKVPNINKENFTDEPFTNNEIFMKLYTSDEIKILLKQYPLLSLEYDVNGNYKNIATLIEEKNSLSRNNDSDILNYEKLIKYRDCDLYSLLNDYYSLFLIDSIDMNLIKEKEEILKNTLPNLLHLKLLLCGKVTKEKLSEIYNEYINPCIKKISQNRVQSKNLNSTAEFLNHEKSNSDNYAGICKLQEILEGNI